MNNEQDELPRDDVRRRDDGRFLKLLLLSMASVLLVTVAVLLAMKIIDGLTLVVLLVGAVVVTRMENRIAALEDQRLRTPPERPKESPPQPQPPQPPPPQIALKFGLNVNVNRNQDGSLSVDELDEQE